MDKITNGLKMILFLSVFPLFHAAIIVLWPGLISFGHPIADHLELCFLVIATSAGGTGAYLDLLVSYCLPGKNLNKVFIFDISSMIRILVGCIIGFLVVCFANAGIMKINFVVNVADPFSVLSWSAIAGFFAIPIISIAKDQVIKGICIANKIWQAFKETVIAGPPDER